MRTGSSITGWNWLAQDRRPEARHWIMPLLSSYDKLEWENKPIL